MIPQPEDAFRQIKRPPHPGRPLPVKKPRRVRGPQAANRVQFIFRGGMHVRREKHFARRECARMG